MDQVQDDSDQEQPEMAIQDVSGLPESKETTQKRDETVVNDWEWQPEDLSEPMRASLANALRQQGVNEETIARITGCSRQEPMKGPERVDTDVSKDGFTQGQGSGTPALACHRLEQMPLLLEDLSVERAEGGASENCSDSKPGVTRTSSASRDEPRETPGGHDEHQTAESAGASYDPAIDHQLWEEKEPEDKEDPVDDQKALIRSGVSGWRMIGASRRGLFHAHEGRYREDDFGAATQAGWHFVAVGDGAGSASLSRVGSREAVQAALEFIRESLCQSDEEAGLTPIGMREVLSGALAEAVAALKREAGSREIGLRDLATTLLILAHRPSPRAHAVVTAQVGDGAVVTWSPSECVLVLGRPEHGRFAGETQFLTSMSATADFRARVRVEEQVEPDVCLFLVMTDGVADDFFPLDQQLQKLVSELPTVLSPEHHRAEARLLQLLAYRKRASFDDRTLVILASPDAERTVAGKCKSR